MKNLSCFIDTITIDGTEYEIVCIPERFGGAIVNEFYIQPASHNYPLRYMFGLDADQHESIEDAFDIAKANAPCYLSEFVD